MKNANQSKHKFIRYYIKSFWRSLILLNSGFFRIPLMCSGDASDLSSNLVVSVVESSNPEIYLLLSILNPDDLAVLSLL
jgi:hypothetical protein